MDTIIAMTLDTQTDKNAETEETKTRLLLQEQTGLGMHCLSLNGKYSETAPDN